MEIPNWQVSHLWLFQWSFFIHKKIIWHKLFFSFRWGNNIIISRCECMSHTHIKRLDGEWWKRNVKKIGILLYYIIQVQMLYARLKHKIYESKLSICKCSLFFHLVWSECDGVVLHGASRTKHYDNEHDYIYVFHFNAQISNWFSPSKWNL